MHKDEPIDFGDGFMFCEVFFGSDMARIAALDPTAPCSLWLVAVDVESARAIVALCVLLPPSDESEADSELDSKVRAAKSGGEVAAAVRGRWGGGAAAVEGVALVLDGL